MQAFRLSSVPIIINSRDRLDSLRELIEWLESAGANNIWICDNASTFPPLLDFLANRHQVVRLDRNLGHRAPWLSGLVPKLGRKSHFVVTDPDVVPDEECPSDALVYFASLLNKYVDIDKVGFGLRIDDLPPSYAHREHVIAWESQFWAKETEPGVYRAPIDTTFALYRPGLGHSNDKALRTGAPFLARHTPWYQDSAHPTPEQLWYVRNADKTVTNWDQKTLPAWLRQLASNQGRETAAQDDVS